MDITVILCCVHPCPMSLLTILGCCPNALTDGRQAKVLAHTHAHTGPAWGLDFSAEGNLLATGGADRTVRLWDVAWLSSVSDWHGRELSLVPDTVTRVDALDAATKNAEESPRPSLLTRAEARRRKQPVVRQGAADEERPGVCRPVLPAEPALRSGAEAVRRGSSAASRRACRSCLRSPASGADSERASMGHCGGGTVRPIQTVPCWTRRVTLRRKETRKSLVDIGQPPRNVCVVDSRRRHDFAWRAAGEEML